MNTTKSIAVLLGLSSCVDAVDLGQQDDELTKTPISAVLKELPNGMACGLAYRGTGWHIDGSCLNKPTLNCPKTGDCDVNQSLQTKGYYWTTASDWGPESVGDFDSAYEIKQVNSFDYERYDSLITKGTTPSDQMLVPPGTVCGFGETSTYELGPAAGARCMGREVEVDGCPMGWTMRRARDAGSINVFNPYAEWRYYWCEYQDPHGLCSNGACARNVPSGTTCGLADTDAPSAVSSGHCEGKATLIGCPTGYTRVGFFDDGRPAGQGLGWCAKN